MTDNKTATYRQLPTQKNLLLFTGMLAVLLIASTVIFGPYVLAITAVAYAVSIPIELAFAKGRKRKLDQSWMVTPLVFALLMPPTAPLWLVGIGSGFGTFFGKSIFGGFGKNIFNPAIVGVLFVTVSFPAEMNTIWLNPETGIIGIVTPMIELNMGSLNYTIPQLLIGNVPGLIGETFRLGILVLGLMMIGLKLIDWRIPVVYIASVFVFTGIGFLLFEDNFVDPVMSIFVGGLLFGAFFLATDPVSAPLTSAGRVVYGLGLGALTVLIRNFTAAPEGVIYAIIIMNAISPLIDNWKLVSKPQHDEVGETA